MLPKDLTDVLMDWPGEDSEIDTPVPAGVDEKSWMNEIGGLDVGMVLALRAVLTQQNVGKVARTFGRSQPGMSNALARMRLIFRDPLLVRTRSGMRLTPRGEDLRDNLMELCAKLDDLSREIAFDPEGPETTFRILATDAASVILGPAIVHHVRKSGPSIVMSVHSQQSRNWDKEQAGEYDVFVGYGKAETSDRKRVEIFRDDLAIVCRPGMFEEHRELRPADIAQLHFIAPSADGSDYAEVVGAWLEEAGLTSRIVIRTSSFSNIPAIVSQTDLIALLPVTLVKTLQPDFPMQIARYSRPLPVIVIHAEWSKPSDSNIARAWFFKMLVDASSRLASSSQDDTNCS